MHSAKVLVAMAMMVVVAESTIIIGVAGGAALAGLLGLKALAVGGFAAGALIGAASRRRSRHRVVSHRRSHGRSMVRKSHRRHGRSVEDETFDEMSNTILDASLNDADDCAKKLVCSLNAQDVKTLEADEAVIASLFGKTAGIDLTSTTVEFDLAALMGRQAGKNQCDTIYARCPYQSKDLMEVMRKEF